MNDRHLTERNRATGFLWAALVALGVTLLFLSAIENMDIWWHLDSGRWMLAHHRYLGEEVRSFSMEGAQWHNFSWLFQVVVALADSWGGAWGVLLLKGVLWWMIFTLLFVSAGGRGAPLSWLLSLLLVSWQLFPSMYLRPHLFEGLYLVILIWLVQREPRRGDAWWYALLILVWANTHASVVVGTTALALHYLVGPNFTLPAFSRLRRRLPIAVLLCALVFATPNGLNLVDILTGHASGEQLYSYIREWLPPEILPPFMSASLVAVAGAALVKKNFLRPAELLLIIVFMILGSGSRRFLFELSLVLVRPTAVLIGELLAGLGERYPRAAGRNGWLAGSILLALLAVGYQPPYPWRIQHATDYPVAYDLYPHAAMAVLQPVLKGEKALKVWNAYGWGGYIGWRGEGRLKVFIDGRTPTIFTEEMMLDAKLSRRRPTMLRSLAEKWQVGAILLRSVTPLPIPPGDPEWPLVAYDSGSVLYLRSDLARRYNLPGVEFDPLQSVRLVSRASAQRQIAQLRQLLSRDDDNALAWFHLAEFLGQIDLVEPSHERETAMLLALQHSVEQAPDQLLARLRLAQWRARLGWPKDKVMEPLIPAIWKVFRSHRTGYEVPVAQLLLRMGQPQEALRLLSPDYWQRRQQLDREFMVWLLRLQAYLDLGDLQRAARTNKIAAWMALDAGEPARRRYRTLLKHEKSVLESAEGADGILQKAKQD